MLGLGGRRAVGGDGRGRMADEVTVEERSAIVRLGNCGIREVGS